MHRPRPPDEVAIDGTTAADNDIEVGDSVTVLTQSGKVDATVTGIVSFGDGGGSLAGATVTLFDPATAQQTMGTPGTFSEILAVGDGSVSDETLRDRVAEVLPADFEALTGEQIAATESGDIKDALSFFSIFLLVFAVISIFVGSFIIFNTFCMLVAQRSRELALLRALGASRRQVNRAVLLEALVVGLIGSTLGLGLGVLLSHRPAEPGRRCSSVTCPRDGLVFRANTVLWAYLTGVIVTVVAALAPARRATHIPPVAALRDDVALPAVARCAAGRSSAPWCWPPAWPAWPPAWSAGAGILWVGVGAARHLPRRGDAEPVPQPADGRRRRQRAPAGSGDRPGGWPGRTPGATPAAPPPPPRP